jgi:coproporphyrinogen III oxidase
METAETTKRSLRTQAAEYFHGLQASICKNLEMLDGRETFVLDSWKHPRGGGGESRTIHHGAVFEKGGVHFSNVQGTLSDKLARTLNVAPQSFRACGISLVLHPYSPMIPTVHCNLRFIELNDGDGWFGGGMDLTPYYLEEEDVVHFHSTLKNVCDQHDPSFYLRFKQQCDQYFYIKHRSEARGVGGIFFDYLREDLTRIFRFIQDVGSSFIPAYKPIVERRKNEPWGEAEKQWQLHRRGRYVEFNLVYDRGTLFGLETEGRVESILMSLPPVAEWRYMPQPTTGSREARLIEVLRTPKNWV